MIAIYVLLGGALGAIAVVLGASWYRTRSGHVSNLGVAVGGVAVIGAVLGYAVGSGRAFAMGLMVRALTSSARSLPRSWSSASAAPAAIVGATTCSG